MLKRQLEAIDVRLEDIYGVISSQKINTLEHLDVQYKWSIYSPTKKAEILEAERANDEVRDILSRMIGAEIRYARMGYWVREAPFGYRNEKVDTQNGKRCILRPHKVESRWVIKMFELRAMGTYTDKQIVDTINGMGYKTRVETLRDKHDRTKIIGHRGGKELTLKVLWYSLSNLAYAGINSEKWTQDKPIRCKFKGLVSIELFNQANRGKIVITDKDGEITVTKRELPAFQLSKGVHNADYPYKKQVLCPHCEKPLYGSAARGKLGKYYAAYHCSRNHSSYRVPKKEFDETLTNYVKTIQIAPEYIEALTQTVLHEWEKRQAASEQDDSVVDTRITELQAQAATVAKNMAFVTSEVSIKYMEEELLKTEASINELTAQKSQQIKPKAFDMEIIMQYVGYFLKHLEYLLLQQMNPVAKAGYFGVLFEKAPTFEEIKSETPKLAAVIELNQLFKQKNNDLGYMVGEVGLEPTRLLRPADFKSAAYTNSATRPRRPSVRASLVLPLAAKAAI